MHNQTNTLSNKHTNQLKNDVKTYQNYEYVKIKILQTHKY